MKTWHKLLIVLALAGIVVLALYAADNTRPMVQETFATITAGFNAAIASVVENPIWVTYIAPIWLYLSSGICSLVTGIIVYKVTKYKIALDMGKRMVDGKYPAGLQGAPQEPERAPVPPQQQT